MASRLSIFHPPGRLGLKANPFGKDVANLELYRALALHGGFDGLDLLSTSAVTPEQVIEDLGPVAGPRVRPGAILNQQIPAASGALLRGQPTLNELGWLRRRAVGDRAYSLLGLVHTIAPLAMREMIGMNLVGPVHPWDAIICTSPSVRDNLAEMLAAWGAHLAERTGGKAPAGPLLPIVPLGVDGSGFAALADRPQARARARAELGLGEGDILILWVGRLSYFEKAFPQPMFLAAQQAAARAGVKVHFAMAGWFPGQNDEAAFRLAAQAHAPDVAVSFVDGNDPARRGDLWAGSDIFLSLVDNIQETFGIAPLEAMAAGLPVVISDWDGYRSTVRHGVEGFLVPTLGGPASPIGDSLALRLALEMDPYQVYVGTVAQHTAVHVGRAAEALAALIASPDLRRRLGAAGRARVAEAFDWPVVARQVHALVDELAAIRAAAPDVASPRRMNPLKTDPFAAFAGFATDVLTLATVITARPGITVEDLRRSAGVPLDNTFSQWRGAPAECEQVLALAAAGPAVTLRDILVAFPAERRLNVQMSVVWMTKMGLLDWLSEAAP
ncbi:MAG: glycosyl transferase, group 1 family protein [Caulobacteraceae bacterium]|nr:glycosyl transferase, group 1 family protein [Caulobacteraceae bacterium]